MSLKLSCEKQNHGLYSKYFITLKQFNQDGRKENARDFPRLFVVVVVIVVCFCYFFCYPENVLIRVLP